MLRRRFALTSGTIFEPRTHRFVGGLADPDPENRARAAKRFGVPADRVFGDADEMLASADLDAAIVAVPRRVDRVAEHVAIGFRIAAVELSDDRGELAGDILAAASPNVLLLELKPEPSPMQNDIVSDPIVMENGFITVRDAAGLGITVDEAPVHPYVFD